jgi:hypothetical protein
LAYQWQINGTNIPTATGQVLTLTNVQPADTGGYRALVSNIAGSIASAAGVLTVTPPTGPTPPAVVVQPQSLDLTTGANTGFCATVASSAPWSSRWFLNGVPLVDGGNLSGATGGCLTILNAQLTNAGTYTLVANNTYGSVTSDGAVLLLEQSGAEVDFSDIGAGVNAPVFDTDGVTRLNGAGYLAQLYAGPTADSLAAVGPAVPFMTGDLAGYWSVLPNSIRNIPAVAPGSPAFVQARVWQSGKGLTFEQAAAAGSKLGQSAVLQIPTAPAGPPLVPPTAWTGLQSFSLQSTLTISVLPVPQTVNVGGTATFNVTAAGTGPFSFQWQINGTPISSATNATLTLTNVQTNQAGNYNVAVGNAAGSVTSATAALTVLTPPIITTAPASQTVVAGTDVRLTVEASGPGTVSYLWNFNGTPIGGATNATLTLTNVQPIRAGNYAVTVSNAAGSTVSSNATLIVLVPPTIVTGPANQTVVAGASIIFSVTATGAGTLSYQWFFNGTPIAGAIGPSLTLTNVQPTQSGNYTVTVSNSTGAAPSAIATLTVLVTPSITTVPLNQTVVAGSNAVFSVVATGTAPLSYQWQFNGAPIGGATNATLALTNVQTAQAGNYNVAVKNLAGTSASPAATLSIAVPPTITNGPLSQTVVASTNVTFSVIAAGTALLS